MTKVMHSKLTSTLRQSIGARILIIRSRLLHQKLVLLFVTVEVGPYKNIFMLFGPSMLKNCFLRWLRIIGLVELALLYLVLGMKAAGMLKLMSVRMT